MLSIHAYRDSDIYLMVAFHGCGWCWALADAPLLLLWQRPSPASYQAAAATRCCCPAPQRGKQPLGLCGKPPI